MQQYLVPSLVEAVEGCGEKGAIVRLHESDVEFVVEERAYLSCASLLLERASWRLLFP